MLRLNLLRPGAVISDRSLEENSNTILTYLRDRGFYNAEVTYSQKSLGNAVDVEVLFEVEPNTQAKVGTFNLEVDELVDEKLAQNLN